MEQNAYRTELDRVAFTEAGRGALTEALLAPRPACRKRPWPRKVLAAGLAAALLVGTAFAAAGPLWEHFFGTLDPDQEAVIQTLSQDLPAVQDNGTTMTPLAAFGDQDFYYLLLEITPPEGTVLPNYSPEEGYYQFMDGEGLGLTLTDAQGQELYNSVEYSWLERSSDAERLTAVIRVWPLEGVDFSDGTGKTLRIPGLWVQTPDKDYRPVLTGTWAFDIGAHTGGIQSRDLDVAGVSLTRDYCDGLYLDALRVSPLGLRWRCHWTGLKDPAVMPGAEAAVVMADGSEITVDSTMGTFHDQECWNEEYGPFEAPVDLSKAVAVRWGEALISLG